MPGWVSDVAPKMVISSSQYGNPIRDRVVHQFASAAERDATARPVSGMMAWCELEKTLYIWQASAQESGAADTWQVFETAWMPWSPDVWSGPTTTFPALANRSSRWRRSWGQCHIFLNVRARLTATVSTDLIYVQPPVGVSTTFPAAGETGGMGCFGSGMIQDSTAGTLGPLAMFNSTQLAVGKLGTGGTVGAITNLVIRNDLAAAGNDIDFYMHGSYPCVLT